MSFRVVSLVLALLLSVMDAHAQKVSESADARALVDAMHLSEHVRAGLEAGVRKAIEQGRSTQKELECTRGANLSFATDAYATAIAAALSPYEIKQAIAFFTTPEGGAYLKYSFGLELHQRGIRDQPRYELTAVEEREVLKFIDKSAGKKLLQDRVHETPELRASLIRGVSALVAQCRS